MWYDLRVLGDLDRIKFIFLISYFFNIIDSLEGKNRGFLFKKFK